MPSTYAGTNGKAAVDFVSFPDIDMLDNFYANGKSLGVWNAELPDYFVQELVKKQREVPNCDTKLTGMLFGRGRNHICLLDTGYMANLDDEIRNDPEHLLYKAGLPKQNLPHAWLTMRLGPCEIQPKGMGAGPPCASSVIPRNNNPIVLVLSSHQRYAENEQFRRELPSIDVITDQSRCCVIA
ncbi:hypothetical protein DFH06DRAFT_1338608 [Mycena polygramma]|nr:hypothetical protein DFH06DRAFT_1338608 [Mycena polygramma]